MIKHMNLGRRDVMVFLMCLCVCSSLWVSYITPHDVDKIPQKLAQTTVDNQNPLWITLAKQILSKQSPDTNVVFSPISMHGMLGLIAAGSNGQTLYQLLSFLKANTVDEVSSRVSKLLSSMADGSSSGGPRLSFVNGVWIEQTLSLKSSFKQVAETVYKAACKQVDFRYKAVEVKQEVNSWVEKQTGGLIKEIIPLNPVDGLTRLILANAVYFKGAWKAKFDPSMTTDSDFHLPNGGKVKVPFMTSNDKQLVGEYDGFKVLGLPYSQGEDKRSFSMYMFLPNEKEGIPSLIEKLGSESNFLERHIPREQVKVGRFFIPKFDISFGFEASNMLKELGLVLPFTPGCITEMVDQGLEASSMHHKVILKVNEEGTEAAAATARVFEDSVVGLW